VTDTVALALAGIGALLALLTFVIVVFEYRRPGRLRRSEQTSAMSSRMTEQTSVERVLDLLEREAAGDGAAAAELAVLPVPEKFGFLRSCEELAVLVRSRLVHPAVAHCMHGSYAVRCNQSKGFWKGDGAPLRDSAHWSVFFEFAEDMEMVEGQRRDPLSAELASER
jgi:hypothetical protein